ncbi:MAG: NADH-quinone oxidoreductase subunit C [Paenibacillaceae bacterium]|jgi:NADH-quinone oxidoreductase subunit C|nr:NADH-quinone oxidoreductase subunit C [Paenibacillaceae bacterium]
MDERWIDALKQALPDEDVVVNAPDGIPTVIVPCERVYAVAQLLRDALGLAYARDVAAVDWETHISVSYLVSDVRTGRTAKLVVHAHAPDYGVPSLTPLYPGFDWGERESYDLLGVHFQGHPNLTRIMMPDEWVGHPLRKNYEPYDPEV